MERTRRTVFFHCQIRPTPSIDYLSPAIVDILGFESEAFYGDIDFLFALVTPSDRLKLARFFENPARYPAPFVAHYRHADGHLVCLEYDYKVVQEGDVMRVEGLAQDVTVGSAQEEELAHLGRELDLARLETLKRLALAAEYRDDVTHEHTQRVAVTCSLVCRNLGLTRAETHTIVLAAPLHDIGKVGIPDKILLKPGSLTPSEFDEMKTHTSIGAAILSGSHSQILDMGAKIALNHHERWDGTGYPRGIEEEAIPLPARILAVADVVDALTHDRPYKQAWSLDRALDEVVSGSATHFDPDVVDALIRIGDGAAEEGLGAIDLRDENPAVTR